MTPAIAPPTDTSFQLQPRLPRELFDHILFHLKDGDGSLALDLDDGLASEATTPPSFPKGRSILASKALLVSHDFYEVAIGILWEHLVLRSPNDLTILIDTLDNKGRIKIPAGRVPLAHRTRRLDIQFKGLYRIAAVKTLLSRLHNLTILTMCNQPWPLGPYIHIPEEIVNAVTKSCPKLARLQFRSVYELPTVLHLTQLATSCKKLRALQVAMLDPLQYDHLPKPRSSTSSLFPSLRTLSLGPGSAFLTFPSYCLIFHGTHTSHMTKFVTMISDPVKQFPALERVDILGDLGLEDDAPFVEQTNCMVEALVCGSAWRLRGGSASRWRALRNLKRLSVILDQYVDPLPDSLDAVEEVEIIQPGPILSEETTETVTHDMVRSLASPRYLRLRSVSLRLTSAYPTQEYWVAEFESVFRSIGVQFVVKALSNEDD